MLLTRMKRGKQIPGALARATQHLPRCATRDPENQFITLENEWAERRCRQ